MNFWLNRGSEEDRIVESRFLIYIFEIVGISCLIKLKRLFWSSNRGWVPLGMLPEFYWFHFKLLCNFKKFSTIVGLWRRGAVFLVLFFLGICIFLSTKHWTWLFAKVFDLVDHELDEMFWFTISFFSSLFAILCFFGKHLNNFEINYFFGRNYFVCFCYGYPFRLGDFFLLKLWLTFSQILLCLRGFYDLWDAATGTHTERPFNFFS